MTSTTNVKGIFDVNEFIEKRIAEIRELIGNRVEEELHKKLVELGWTPPAQPLTPAAQSVDPWRPMDTAPEDGTDVLLLIADPENPLQDANPSVTIGTFGVEGGPEEDPTWTFAGWCWVHDHYVRGVGTPIGWLPRPSTPNT